MKTRLPAGFLLSVAPGACFGLPCRLRRLGAATMDLFAESRDLTGLEMLRKMLAEGRGPPIADTLKFTLAEVEHGRAVFRGTPGPHAYNPIGVVHGGYAATLLDSA